MPTHPDPPCLTLARAIRDLLHDSGASVSDQSAALEIAQHLVNAEYAEDVLGPTRRAEKAERMAITAAAAEDSPKFLNVDARNPDPNRVSALNPYGGKQPVP